MQNQFLIYKKINGFNFQFILSGIVERMVSGKFENKKFFKRSSLNSTIHRNDVSKTPDLTCRNSVASSPHHVIPPHGFPLFRRPFFTRTAFRSAPPASSSRSTSTAYVKPLGYLTFVFDGHSHEQNCGPRNNFEHL